jgi:hypothetical protein
LKTPQARWSSRNIGRTAHIQNGHGAWHGKCNVVAKVACVEADLSGCSTKSAWASRGIAGGPLATVVTKLYVEIAGGCAGIAACENQLKIVLTIVVRRVVTYVVPGNDNAVGFKMKTYVVACWHATTAGVDIGPPRSNHGLHRNGKWRGSKLPKTTTKRDVSIVVDVHRIVHHTKKVDSRRKRWTNINGHRTETRNGGEDLHTNRHRWDAHNSVATQNP